MRNIVNVHTELATEIQQYIRGYLQEPITRCQLIISQHVVETIICNSCLTEAGVINPVTGCVCSVTCVCFDRCEDWSLKIQTRKKSLYSFWRIYTNIQFPHWLGKALFWQLLIKLRQSWPGCCSPSVRPISLIKLKPMAKIKRDSLSFNVSVGPYPTCNCFRILQVFFFSPFFMSFYWRFAWCIQCYSDCTKYYAAIAWGGWRWGYETFDGSTGRREMGWADMSRDTRVKTAATISWGEGKTWRVKAKMGLMGCWGEKG